MERTEALAYRIRAQQLDRAMAPRGLTDADILDFGVQDTGRDGASWALANRGVPVASAGELESSPTWHWPGRCEARRTSTAGTNCQTCWSLPRRSPNKMLPGV